MTAQETPHVTLGGTSIQVSPLGLGTWAWGDTLVWSYGRGYSDDDIRDAFNVSLNAGITLIDTAEVYGNGKSESWIGRFLKETDIPTVIATKFMPYPWRFTGRSLRSSLTRSLKRLQLESVDLYQMHWPFPPVPVRCWMDAMADVVEDGLVRAVGVSNYSKNQMRRAYDRLAGRNIPLVSNQVEYSLLVRKPETSGLLDLCNELNVTLIAYSPLAMGMLTGKYSTSNPPSGLRARRFRRRKLRRIERLVGLMRELGEDHGGKSPAQVALNWTMCKGTVPIPGAKTGTQAEHNAGALNWRLTNEAVDVLDRFVSEHKLS